VFVEGHIPLFISKEGPYGPRSLTLSVAGREEHYSDVGSTSIPLFSLTDVPVRDLELLATWDRSFRAPTLLEEYNATQLTLKSFSDPGVPSGESVGLLRFGGNPRLRPESARTASMDVSFTPAAWKGAVFELTYYDTLYGDRIELPTANTGNPLADPNILPFIQRNPSAAGIAQLFAQSQYTDLTEGKYVPSDASVIIDDRYHNIAEQHASGVDFRSSYSRDTGIGNLGGSLNLAYLDLRQRVIGTSPLVEISGTLDNPPAYRGRLGLNWSQRPFSASIFLNEIGQSRDPDSNPQQKLSPWTTVDAQVGYTSLPHSQWGTTHLTLAAQNLFNRRPPLFNVQQQGAAIVNFDWTNTSAEGCFVTLQVTQSW
jgi:outer membrane cobalamin receptor